jgi:uncharacterized protein YajQ (UPF0234 family)
MSKNYDKEAFLAGYRAQRGLANKYGISAAMVSKLTKNAVKNLTEPANKQIEARLDLASRSEQEIHAIEHAVKFQLGILKDIELGTKRQARTRHARIRFKGTRKPRGLDMA